MIPQFKPFEGGSIWYDIQARSDRECVRLEDEFKLAVFRKSADNTSLDDEKKAILKTF